MFCYPLLGLLSGVNGTLTILLALVIPYSGNTKERCDPGFSVDTFYINKLNLCYPFLSHLGVGPTDRSKGKPTIASIGHSVLGNPKVRYYTNFSIAFLHKYMSILLPHFITHFWVAVRGNAKLKILALVSQYSEKPNVR